jgi:hypothetical protein
MKRFNASIVLALLASFVLVGCTTYSQPRYGASGVYYERAYYPPATRVHVDPLVYPYWSLDYFYFSRHYHPYSVVVHRHDPWFYPYPGWYYGYRPPARSQVGFSYRYYYPWYTHGAYHHYRPWHSSVAFSYWHVSAPRHHYSSRERVRQENRRIQELRYRQSQAAQAPPYQRPLPPRVAPRIPSSSRPHTGRVQPRRVPPETRRHHGTHNMPLSPATEFRHDRRQFEPEPRVPDQVLPTDRQRFVPPRHEGRSPAPSQPTIRSSQPRTEQSTAPPRGQEPAPPRSRSERRTRRPDPPPSHSSAPRSRDAATTRHSRSTTDHRRQRQREH